MVALMAVTLAHAAPILGAGQGGEGWVAIESVWEQGGPWSLYQAPRAGEAGTMLRVRSLASGPEAMAAFGGRLLLVYAPTDPERDAYRSVRGLRAEALYEGRSYRYTPPDREEVLAPLPAWGELAGLLALERGAVALLRDESAGRAGLFVFDFTEWEEVSLPERLDGANALALAPQGEGYGVVEHRPGGSVVWTRDTDGAWASSGLMVDVGERILAGANGALIGVRRSPGGTVLTRLLRSDRALPLARIEGAPVEYASMAVGENIVVAWLHETRLRLEVISSSSGEIVFSGDATRQSILSTNDLQYLGLLMLAVLLMVLIFVLRPSPDAIAEVHLPEGVAPAAPGRRLLAAAIDLAPVAWTSMLIWDASAMEAVGLDVQVSGAGVMPLLTTIAGVLVLQTVCEWRFAWTPGKLLTGCRTVSVEQAKRPTFRQAFVRNLVKYACPPLAAMIIADPTRRHPGDFFAGTIVIAPAAGEDDASAPRD
ncbi:MAG: RDD family protein [Phycisphaerales bacterium]